MIEIRDIKGPLSSSVPHIKLLSYSLEIEIIISKYVDL